MKPIRYVAALIITICIIINIFYINQAIQQERALISNLNDLNLRVAALEGCSNDFVTYEAIQPALDEMTAHNELVKQYSARVDDMILSYNDLNEVLKNMGYEAQRQYEKILKARRGN